MQHFSSRKGFSLLEIIFVVAAGSIVVLIISSFSNNLSVLKNIVGQKLQSRSDVEQTLQLITTEIRSAAPSVLGGYPIEAASTSSFTFFSDFNEDGFIDHVRYFFTTSTIKKGIIKPSGSPLGYPSSTEIITTAIDNVTLASATLPIFRYYDDTYTGTQTPLTSPIDATRVRLVNLSFYTDIGTSTAPRPEFFTITVDMRNLKSN